MGTAPASGSVELLSSVAEPSPPSQSGDWRPKTRRRIRRGLLIGLVVYFAIQMTMALIERGQGRIGVIDTFFGDPFAAEWTVLDSDADRPSDNGRPPPMVSDDMTCVGFGRLDWSPSERSPSVARCVEPAALANLQRRDVAVLWESVAGDSTWYFLAFAPDLDRIEVEVDGTGLSADQTFQTGRLVALLLSNGYERLELSWYIDGGSVHQCKLEAGSIVGQECLR